MIMQTFLKLNSLNSTKTSESLVANGQIVEYTMLSSPPNLRLVCTALDLALEYTNKTEVTFTVK